MGEYDQIIKMRREEALKALNAARAIKTELADAVVWPADKTAAFEAHMADFQKFHSEAEVLSTRQTSVALLDAQQARYTEPGPSIAHKGPDGPGETAEVAARKAHTEAFHRYIRQGDQGLTRDEFQRYIVKPQEQYALISSVDNLGGFLVPDEFFNELIRDLPGFTVMRPICKVRRTMRQTGSFMTVRSGTNPYSSGLSGNWKPEGYVTGGTAPPTQDQPTFGMERVPTHIWAPDVIEITIDLLEDAMLDLDAEIRGLLAEVKGLDEDWGFLKGTGVGMPQGIMTIAGISTVNSGEANGQSYAGIVNLYTNLPAQYRPRATWIMNSLTYGLLLLVADDQNRPLFPVNQLIGQLFNRPIAFSEFMDDGDTNGNHPIIFGDFSYYGIVDRRDMRIQRLTERYAPNIGLLAYARTGGQPLKTGPFRKQVVGA